MASKERGKNNNRHDQPLDILSGMAGKAIFIRLMDRTEVIGQLLDFDQYMNLKIGLDDENILIRGNNVILIATDWEEIQPPEDEAGSSK